MNRIRLALLIASTVLASCTDLPDYDDPRDEQAARSCDNLLGNGDFDDGPVSWTPNGSNIIYNNGEVPTGTDIRSDTGSFFLWLGGVFSATRTVTQSFRVPRVTQLALKGKYVVASETEVGPIEDTLKIELFKDATAAVVDTALTLTNVTTTVRGDEAFRWTSLSVMIDSELVAGELAILRLGSVNDAQNNTNFLFDSLTLKPSSCD